MSVANMTIERIRELAEAEGKALADHDNRPVELDVNNRPVPQAPDERYWGPLEAWLDDFDPSVFPKAAATMRELRRAYEAFNISGVAFPPAEFWTARDEAHKACSERPPEGRLPETIEELTRQKVSDKQICVIWGFTLTSGLPDFGKLARERATPGSVLTAEYKAAIIARQLVELGWGPKTARAEPEPAKPVVDEPAVESLLSAGANIEQVAGIKYRQYQNGSMAGWRAAVTSLAELMGVKAPVNAQSQLAEARQELLQKHFRLNPTARVEPGLPPMGDMEASFPVEGEEPAPPPHLLPSYAEQAQVVELFAAGNDAAAIARETGVPVGRVSLIIKDWQGTPVEGSK